MLTIDLIIGIILIVIGSVVLCYMTYTLIRKKHVKMSPLYISEALATLILGIFYVVCSCIITTGSTISITLTVSPPVATTAGNTTKATIPTLSTLSEPVFDPIEEKALHDLYNPENFHQDDSNITFTSENAASTNTNNLLEEFIKYYKESFGNSTYVDNNSIQKLITINRLGKKLIESNQKLSKVELSTESDTELLHQDTTQPAVEIEDEDCSMYDEIYFKYMMLIVAFIYGIISLFNSTIECKTCTVNSSPTPSTTSDDKVFISKQSDENDADTVATSPKRNIKSFVQVLLAWFLPIIYAVIVTVTMKPSELPTNLLFDVTQFTESPSDIINIIANPLNVSNIEINGNQSKQIDSVIDNIYNIMKQMQDNFTIDENATDANSQPPYDILETLQGLKETVDTQKEDNVGRYMLGTPKRLKPTDQEELIPQKERKCSLEMMPLKLHTLIVFIIAYSATIFYAKLTHTKLSLLNKDQQQVKMLGKYILAFASLWLPSMLEVFTRAYLMDAKTTVATDLTLALGNITRLLANGINVRNIRQIVKQFNHVRPASEDA